MPRKHVHPFQDCPSTTCITGDNGTGFLLCQYFHMLKLKDYDCIPCKNTRTAMRGGKSSVCVRA